jgi:hypothetical protein
MKRQSVYIKSIRQSRKSDSEYELVVDYSNGSKANFVGTRESVFTLYAELGQKMLQEVINETNEISLTIQEFAKLKVC